MKKMRDEILAKKVEGKWKTGIAMGDCIKNSPEGVSEEWKTMIDRSNWSLLTENVEREK